MSDAAKQDARMTVSSMAPQEFQFPWVQFAKTPDANTILTFARATGDEGPTKMIAKIRVGSLWVKT